MSGALKILIVEDNPADVKLIEVGLSESSVNHHVFVVSTLYECITFCSNNDLDVVLLDLSLPDSTGFRTLNSFLKSVSEVPVIVLTGMNNEIVGTQSIKAGAQDFLTKGQFDYRFLPRILRYAIHRHQSQRKISEAAKNLSISELRYKEAQEMAHFGNWEIDIVTNEMKWTAEVYRIFGFNPGGIVPSLQLYKEMVHHEDISLVKNYLDKAVKDGKPCKTEYRVVLDGTTIKHVAVQSKIHYDELTERTLLVGVIQDITERKLSEMLILEKNINQQAARKKKKAISEFSFHIRTPMSTITNFLYLLDKDNISRPQLDLVNGLKTSFDDLFIMINNLLNFSFIDSDGLKLEYSEFDFKALVQSIEKVAEIKADNAGVRLKFNTDVNIPQLIVSDQLKMNHILYNLLENAINFAEKRAKLRVSVTHRSIEKNKAMLQVTLTEQGKKMSRQEVAQWLDVDRILTVYQSDGLNDKNPLGIAVATKLTQIMGGKLDIISELQEGTTFKVELPVQTVSENYNKSGSFLSAPMRILLVEDHFLNQIGTKKLLTTWSKLITVDIAENGLVGLDKCREYDYDLILMDIQMPVMTGFEATEKIRLFSDIPIIALTANSSKQEAEKCLESGMNDYLPKPFRPEQLFSKIVNLVRAKVRG